MTKIEDRNLFLETSLQYACREIVETINRWDNDGCCPMVQYDYECMFEECNKCELMHDEDYVTECWRKVFENRAHEALKQLKDKW